MRDALRLRPASPHFTQPDLQAIQSVPAIVAIYFASFDQAQFPDAGYPCKVIECESRVEMGGCGCKHLFCPQLSALAKNRLNRTDTLPAAATDSIDISGAGESGVQEINGPAIEIDTIDQVLFTLGGFAEMFARRVIRIGYRALAVTVVDRILAPDIALANVNAFLSRPGIADFQQRENRQ